MCIDNKLSDRVGMSLLTNMGRQQGVPAKSSDNSQPKKKCQLVVLVKAGVIKFCEYLWSMHTCTHHTCICTHSAISKCSIFFPHTICLRKLCICPGIVILLFLILCGKKYDTQLSFFSQEQYNLNSYFSLACTCTFSFFVRYLLYMHPWKLLSSFSKKKRPDLSWRQYV